MSKQRVTKAREATASYKRRMRELRKPTKEKVAAAMLDVMLTAWVGDVQWARSAAGATVNMLKRRGFDEELSIEVLRAMKVRTREGILLSKRVDAKEVM